MANAFVLGIGIGLLGLSAGASWGASAPAQICTAAKEKAAGKTIQCRTAAYGKAADLATLDAALAKCGAKMDSLYAKAEDKASTACPTSGDAVDVDAFAADVGRQLGAYLTGATALLSCQSAPVEPLFAPDGPAQECIANKAKAAGKAVLCRMNAHAKFAKSGNAAKRDDDLAKCRTTLGKAFAKLETKYPGACRTSGDDALVDQFATDATDPLAAYLPGTGTLPVCRLDTPTPTPTSTWTDVPTSTSTPTPTITDTPTSTVTDTPTATATATPTQTATDTATPDPCGNGTIDANEQCDGTNLALTYCRDLLGTTKAGPLRCSSTCTYDTSACVTRQNPQPNALLDGTPIPPDTEIRGNRTHTLTAIVNNPQAVDADQLQYHWVIKNNATPEGYSDQGITGYLHQILTMSPNSLIVQQGPTRFELTITDAVGSGFGTATFSTTVTMSTLTLDVFNDCVGQTVACDECTCTVAAGLPTNEPR